MIVTYKLFDNKFGNDGLKVDQTIHIHKLLAHRNTDSRLRFQLSLNVFEITYHLTKPLHYICNQGDRFQHCWQMVKNLEIPVS
jgi:hypothetical protein